MGLQPNGIDFDSIGLSVLIFKSEQSNPSIVFELLNFVPILLKTRLFILVAPCLGSGIQKGE